MLGARQKNKKLPLPSRTMRARHYTPWGYRAQNVKPPVRRLAYNLAAAACILLVPVLIMLDIRENTAVAEWWTTHIQAGWEVIVGTLTSWLPFSVTELLIVLGVLLGLYLFVRLIIDLCRASFYRILVGLLSLVVGGVYLVGLYVMSMGFGYYRAEMPIPQAGKDYSLEQCKTVIEYYLSDYNRLADGFKRDKNGCVISPYSFSELADLMKKEFARLDDDYFSAYTPTAKPVVNSWMLSALLTTGVTFLPFGEASLNVAAPPTTITFTLAHELAHTKGVQREGDANLLASYVLLTSDDDYLRYCGYYRCFDNLLYSLLLADDYEAYNELGTSVSRAVIKEQMYASDYWNSQPDIIGRISEFFNNWYLQSNGAQNGTGSYDDGNKSEVIIPTDPETGEPEKDPETGEIVRIINYSQVQMMFFWMYENRT